jgi:hypothetical protein
MLKKLLIIVFLFSCIDSLRASNVVILNASCQQYILSSSDLDVLEDTSNKWGISQVSSPAFKEQFHTNTEVHARNENVESAYWIRFQVKNDVAETGNWLVEFYDHTIDQIEFYLPDSLGTYSLQKGGNALMFSAKYLKHKNLAFKFPLNHFGKTDTFYLRIKSRMHVQVIPVIRSYEQFTYYSLNEYYFLGIFYGVILAMIIYNLILYFGIRDKSYLYFIFCVFSFGVFSMCQDGTAFQYLWPSYPELNNKAFGVAVFSIILWALVYTRSFLITRIYNHFFNEILLITIRVRVAIFLLAISFFPSLLNLLWLDFIPLFICYMAGIFSLRRGYKPARYYVLGFSLLFIGFFISVLDFIPNIPIVFYSSKIGAVLQMMVLSIALSDRIKTFKVEKENAQQEMIVMLEVNQQLKNKANIELEQKVAERTADLLLANIEIKRMNVLLNEENENLEINLKELARARVMLKDVDFDEFSKIYPDEESCYKFLAEMKWNKGYTCFKCENEKFSPGRVEHSRRCTKCGFDESPIGNTIFSGIKFSIVKAFYIVFLFYSSKKKITSTELSRILVLRQKTCWSFMQKIIEVGNKRPSVGGWTSLILDEDSEDKI